MGIGDAVGSLFAFCLLFFCNVKARIFVGDPQSLLTVKISQDFFYLTQDFVLDMPDFDGLQPFLFAHITAIRPFLFLVTARENCRLRMFYVFWESRVYAVAVETT